MKPFNRREGFSVFLSVLTHSYRKNGKEIVIKII